MSFRQRSNVLIGDVISSKEKDRESSMAKIFNEKVSFSGAVGTLLDVEPISNVYRSAVQRRLTISNSNNDIEWRNDINGILKMIIDKGFEVNIQVMKKGKNDQLELTDVSIGIDRYTMTVLDGSKALKEFTRKQKLAMVTFLEKYFTNTMKLELKNVVFRIFDP